MLNKNEKDQKEQASFQTTVQPCIDLCFN